MKHNLLETETLQPFERHLYSHGKSENTVSSYLTNIRSYFRWFQEKYDKFPETLYRENVDDYLAFLRQKEMAPSTFNSHLSSLRSWNEYLVQVGKQEHLVLEKRDFKRVQQGYASPAVYSEDDIQRFLQAVLESGSKRDYTLINLLAYTGVRISEALSLSLTDLHFDAQELVVREGKGGKARTVFLSRKVVRLLRDYIKSDRSIYKRAEVSRFVFLSNRSRQLSRITVFKFFSKYSQSAGIQPALSPHDLRHFFCSNALAKGFDVHEVASMAGHSNIHTTLLYTNPSRKEMLNKLDLL